MTKRSFFKSFMGAVTAVALAPEIAFGKLSLPEAPKFMEWVVTMKWKDGGYLNSTLSFPCPDEAITRWLNHNMNLAACSDPPPESVKYDVVRESPYSELQKWRKEAGLTVE